MNLANSVTCGGLPWPLLEVNSIWLEIVLPTVAYLVVFIIVARYTGRVLENFTKQPAVKYVWWFVLFVFSIPLVLGMYGFSLVFKSDIALQDTSSPPSTQQVHLPSDQMMPGTSTGEPPQKATPTPTPPGVDPPAMQPSAVPQPNGDK